MALKSGTFEFWYTLTVEFYRPDRASWSYISGTISLDQTATRSDVFDFLAAQLLEARNGVFQRSDMKVIFFDVQPNSLVLLAPVATVSEV